MSCRQPRPQRRLQACTRLVGENQSMNGIFRASSFTTSSASYNFALNSGPSTCQRLASGGGAVGGCRLDSNFGSPSRYVKEACSPAFAPSPTSTHEPLPPSTPLCRHHPCSSSTSPASVPGSTNPTSGAWNAGFFLIVFIFNLIVGVGVSALDGNDALICSYDKPAVTRLVPFLVMYPYASFCIRILSEGFAAVLALWAMLPSFRHATPAAAGME